MTLDLESLLKDGTYAKALRESQAPPFAMPRLAPEYSNWIDEQKSWREAACLYDQSHHMTDLTLRGSGVVELLSGIAVNDFTNFPVNTAKQLVAVNNDGFIIGDVIINRLAEDEYRTIGGPDISDWIHFHAETRGEDVEVIRDDNSYVRQGDPEFYRYQIQGPKALDIVRDLIGGEPPKLKFFHLGVLEIAGVRVRALRHGMAGEPGYELFGPWADGEKVKQAILSAGAAYGIRLVGGLAYLTNTIESGWIPRPVSALVGQDPLEVEFRAWRLARTGGVFLPSLGGSHYSEDITDYFFTVYELGYGRVVRFDHDFIGRAALERQVAAGEDKARTKVTLIWDADDLAQVFASQFAHDGLAAKWPSLPIPLYSTFQFDKIVAHGKQIGRTGWTAYSANEGAMLSLATIDSAYAAPGTEVTVYWGEDPNSTKPTVERHKQVAVRAIVGPVPIGESARERYRKDVAH
ncbi:aminomethyl transferase family protein [Microbacterium sp.]|uniref:aminomethyl transferase family protein n=1 Tax=Microbacterium sp. TaxID=51671 RepID=UPI003A947B56